MDKILGNYLTQSNRDFPFDAETLDYIQNNAAMTAILGNIGGDKIILSGCEPTNNGANRNKGYVFVRTQAAPQGEILRFEGGSTSGMYLKTEAISVDAQGNRYPTAYTKRSLASGIGNENFSWSDFKSINTNLELEAKTAELQKQIELLAPPPLGMVQIWAGAAVPNGYELCVGQQLKTADYPALYASIGDNFNTKKDRNGTEYSTNPGYFRLPDLRGRFIVGHDVDDTDYKKYGYADGLKKVKLKPEEMPKHTHGWKYGLERDDDGSGRSYNEFTMTPKTTSNTVSPIEETGNDESHENRPPYYVLAYIMRLK